MEVGTIVLEYELLCCTNCHLFFVFSIMNRTYKLGCERPYFIWIILICYTYVEILGKTGQEALIITEKDEVFACGSNYSYCLGTGKVGPQIEPVKVSELCYKNVKGKLAEWGKYQLDWRLKINDWKLFFNHDW